MQPAPPVHLSETQHSPCATLSKEGPFHGLD
jgi:hypothetical protein